ncbi:hypothetical protein TBLA_0A05660 [Henningerozyma blattae CBS 6284]|uniref:Folic acid synthesis protein fol1 n=1 Tax=Henningerozyma blattae (strain ATCC 34711 / CBS 6284 / DSM 70876 / NBRC 10599 / NRRL Y-10934 / UCD 77-7) TaxID=1071380 RepID=I2GW57_HENB6|nr:hypothetical protein TBLA_0A05660 [Tetrapisispora blattae CBS 6284]CCH58359.1 hypothetical protein TBLA_0A05660 [Tetrapisispora blattae CBS 6284]
MTRAISMMSRLNSGIPNVDRVHIDKLRIQSIVGPDAWGNNSPQDCQVSLEMKTDFSRASINDDLDYSLNYATISNDITKFTNAEKTNWLNIGNLARQISQYVINKYPTIQNLKLNVNSQNLHIRCNDVTCSIDTNLTTQYDFIELSNIKLLTLIGIFDFERLQKQYIDLKITLPWPKNVDERSFPPINEIINDCVECVENSTFLTVEALVNEVMSTVISNEYYSSLNTEVTLPIDIKVIKLNAITATDGVGVSCKRFINSNIVTQSSPTSSLNLAFLAFGSNIDDRFDYVKQALDLLDKNPDIKILDVSSIFESEPKYFVDQDPFMNGVVKINTRLPPSELLKVCKDIEYNQLKRVKEFDNGPRSIDLDIILYFDNNNQPVIMNESELIIPHPRMLERTFVLEPLVELIPPTLKHPITQQPILSYLNLIYSKKNEMDLLWKLIPLPTLASGKPRFLRFMNKISRDACRKTVSPTYLMGILNTTPDSFSDGKTNNYKNINKQLLKVHEFVQDSLTLHDNIIIDIGGCSTRPNSIQAPIEEEIDRTIELIHRIRQDTTLPQDKIILSIDTYRSIVAKKAIEAGVDIINDISGGTFDPDMFSVVSKYANIAYILSHIRGDINTMNKMSNYSNTSSLSSSSSKVKDNTMKEYLFDKKSSSHDFIKTIGYEMSKFYHEAIGVHKLRRWQIILDPGLGFAKNGQVNVQLIRQTHALKHYSRGNLQEFINFRNLPILLGPSRKKFIGHIIQEDDAKKRDFATGTVVSACIGFGADIVRIHNVRDNSQGIKMADALYKEF